MILYRAPATELGARGFAPRASRHPTPRYPASQIDARLELGAVAPQRSIVRDLGLVSDEATMPLPAEAEVRERLRKLTLDPVSMLLRLRDSLLLSEAQIERVEAQRAEFAAQADSLMAPMVGTSWSRVTR